MKTTQSINLASRAFNIDDDALTMLRDYFDRIRHHLSQDEADEVMQDIEARAAELFAERMNKFKDVVTTDDVLYIMETLGSPEQFGDEESDNCEESTERKTGRKTSRKFYRDADNRIIAGVGSGLAKLLGWDATVVRLLLFLLLFVSFGAAVVIYVLLWVIVPEAATVAERLEADGIEPTARNISDYSRTHPQAERPQPKSNAFLTILKVMGYLIIIPIAAVLLFVVFVVIAALLGMTREILPDLMGHSLGLSPGLMVLFAVLAVAANAIPIAYLIIYIVRRVRHSDRRFNRAGLAVAAVVWVMTLVGLGFTAVYGAKQVDRERLSLLFSDDDDYELPAATETETRLRGEMFSTIVASKPLSITVVNDTVNMVEVTGPQGRLGKISTEITDGVLTITSAGRDRESRGCRIAVHCTTPPEKVIASTGVRLTADTLICSQGLTIVASSAAEINIDSISAPLVTVEMASGAEATVNCLRADTLTARASSGSELNLGLTHSREVSLVCSSGSSIEVAGVAEAEHLSARASSGSDIELKAGHARHVTLSASAGSEIDADRMTADRVESRATGGAEIEKPVIRD